MSAVQAAPTQNIAQQPATGAETRSQQPPGPAQVPPAEASPAAPAAAVKICEIDCKLTYEVTGPTDFLFLLHALHGMDQQVLSETLELTPSIPAHTFEDPSVHHRFLRLHAEPGTFELRYRARVRRTPQPADLAAQEVPVRELPDALMHNLMPTRYCESDLLGRTAYKLFGELPPGQARVQAIVDWVHDNIDYTLGSSTASTTARDVYLQRAGVCRDFAHLAVTFCRALNIPARLVVGYARFEEPPPDFHAIFEAYLGGRWVMFDPTRMSPVDEMVRIAIGRDAKDVAFATIFGPARMTAMEPLISVEEERLPV